MTFFRMMAPALLVFAAAGGASAQPFQGTAFITPDVLTVADPTGLQNVTYTGRGERVIFDRRVDAWITVDAYLFDVGIHGRDIEFQVNPEFGSEAAARAEVDVFAPALGRLPAVLLSRAEKVHVNAGDGLFGGNWDDRSFLIHTGYGRGLLRDGFLEEVLFHEGAHVSLDGAHASSAGWRAAQQADGGFISTYARDFPDREDMAESVLPYFAVRYRPDRLSTQQRESIEAAIPNRLRYFDDQGLDWMPYAPAMSGWAATVSFEQPTYTATERGAAAEVVVLLSAALDREVTIPLNTDPAGLTEADYTLEAVAPARVAPPVDAAHAGLLNLTLSANTTSATLRITALDDPEDDSGELHIVILEDELPADVDRGTPGRTVVEFREAGPETTVSFAAAAYTATEGGSAAVEVRLSAALDRQVTIPLVTDPSGDGVTEADYTLEALAPARLVVNDATRPDRVDLTIPADASAATLTVTAVDDTDDDPGALYIGIRLGELPPRVAAGDPSSTLVELREAAVSPQPAAAVQAAVNDAIATATAGEGLRTGGASVTVPLDGLFTFPASGGSAVTHRGVTFSASSSAPGVVAVTTTADGPGVVLTPGAEAGSARATVDARPEDRPSAPPVASVTFDVQVHAAVPALPAVAAVLLALLLSAAGLRRYRVGPGARMRALGVHRSY